MSDLSAQLSAFKNKIRSGPSVVVPRRVVPPPKPAPAVSPVKLTQLGVGGKRGAGSGSGGSGGAGSGDSVTDAFKRHKAANGQISGSHLSTQLHLAVEYVKQHDSPIPVKKLQDYLSFDINQTLLPLLKEIDRIKYNETARTLEYVSLHNIRSSADLLSFLRSQPTFKGVAVKELRDGWSGCLEAIDELEEQHKILVLKTKKENTPRLIWANLGGEMGLIDQEFCSMWSDVRIPDQDNLYQALIDHSLKPTGADPMLLKKKQPQQEKKQKKARRGKVTNTHMKGILKDYSQMS